ncbi:hypothetical protein AG0111_0g11112 [Alternaria gaisen]|uniref:Uncharacterized protein n=1 Tax=Alternaria gaisen TaxID=167740 RepID=A0ACB6F853_9PLEO|nr:hypothetical protein AG0111_0g11112 [Alternaria gaisen]
MRLAIVPAIHLLFTLLFAPNLQHPQKPTTNCPPQRAFAIHSRQFKRGPIQFVNKPTNTMAAISMPIAARAEYALHQLAKRDKNWAQREPGVIVVFVIVFLVAVLVIAMFINKKRQAAKGVA